MEVEMARKKPMGKFPKPKKSTKNEEEKKELVETKVNSVEEVKQVDETKEGITKTAKQSIVVDIEVYGDHKPKKSTRKKRKKKRDKKKKNTIEVYDPEEQEVVPVEVVDIPTDKIDSTTDIGEGKDEEDTDCS